MIEELEILGAEEITKEIVVQELSNPTNLSQDEIDEYLEIIIAINDKNQVFNILTNKGEFLMYIKGENINNTKSRSKNKDI